MIWFVCQLTGVLPVSHCTHFNSGLWVATSTARAFDDSCNNLLEVLCQHESVNLLDDRVRRADE